ncbi:MAG: MotA/TolQ/ExbB proton channel family protein [Elusimicrobia bacterium]|jgi:biopolymer transport protein ExbB/biopolymer transport protein TolQ|nr:MotA/TolQ/ExbB proton channel family protein [Elusimicrobiota bacterium]
MDFTLKEIFKSGGPIFIFLILLSIYSIAIIIEKYKQFKRIVKKNLIIIGKANHFFKINKGGEFIKHLVAQKNILSEIVTGFINHNGTLKEKREYLSSMLEHHNTQLSKKLNTLATIGSISPFIGLFGTVIGVVKAFKDMAAFQSAGPAVIAQGISEALVNTAMGLFVAIPAVVAYNYFISEIDRFNSEINWFTEQMIDRYNKNENT